MANEAERLETLIGDARGLFQDLKAMKQELDRAASAIGAQYVADLKAVLKEALDPLMAEVEHGVLELLVDDKVQKMVSRAFDLRVTEHTIEDGPRFRIQLRSHSAEGPVPS
jgi:hypothetical protein